MAFNVENTSGSLLDISDLGITLTIGEISDLSLRSDPQQLALSAQSGEELSDLITAGTLVIKDPIDGTTNLSVADGLAVARAINDTHWRIGAGGRIDDISDVDTTGITTDDVLQWNGSTFVAAKPETVGGGASFQLEWRFSTNTTAADPGNSNFRYNNSTLASVTNIYFDDNATGGFDVGTIFSTLASGDKIYIQQNTDANKAALFTLSGSPTDNTGWWTIPVTVDASGTLHDNNAKCATLFFQSGSGGVSADMDSVQARRTADFTMSTTFADITFDTTDVENNTAVVEHDSTNTERLILKTAGLYKIYYGMSTKPSSGSSEAVAEADSRVQVNGAGGALPGSVDQVESIFDSSVAGNTIQQNLVRTFLYEATANDFVTLQVQEGVSTGTITLVAQDVVFGAIKLTGPQGPAGPAGSGTTIIVQDEGATVTGGPHDTINFIGGAVTATDGTGGVADITIGGGGTPGGVDSNVQYNNAGAFGGEANFIYDDTLKRVAIDGVDETTQVTIGGTSDLANASNAALYVEVQDPSSLNHTGLYTYFNRQSPNINGFIAYEYDGFTPNISICDEDDDPPYVHFDVIGSGTRAAPQFTSRFGMRGPMAGATTGFSWYVQGTETMTLDSTFLNVITGATYQINGVDIVVPSGGTTGQVLEKIDATNYNMQWATSSGGGMVTGISLNSGANINAANRSVLNFIEGSNVTLTIADDAAGDEVDITIDVAGGAGTANDAVQARRTTGLTITTAFQDVTFDATDVETDAAVVEHDNVNTDDIDIKVTGTYQVFYDIDVEPPGSNGDSWIITGRVRLNDAGTGIVGSQANTNVWKDSSIDGTNFPQHLSNSFIANFTANDFITLQIDGIDESGSGGAPATRAGGVTFKIIRLI